MPSPAVVCHLSGIQTNGAEEIGTHAKCVKQDFFELFSSTFLMIDMALVKKGG